MDHELSAPVQVDLHGRDVRAAEPPVPNGPPGHRGAPRPGSRPRATTGDHGVGRVNRAALAPRRRWDDRP